MSRVTSGLALNLAVASILSGCGRGNGLPARLKNDGQFEYFYLLITNDGQMYLIAEYSYG